MGRGRSTVHRLKLSLEERKFEALLLDGTSPREAAMATGLSVKRALALNDRVTASDLAGLLSRRWAERWAEQHAALYSFYANARAEVMEDLHLARESLRGASGDPVESARWRREVQAFRAELMRVEERLRALGAQRRPDDDAPQAALSAPPPPVLPPEGG